MKPVGWLVVGLLVALLAVEEVRLERLRARIGELEASAPAVAGGSPEEHHGSAEDSSPRVTTPRIADRADESQSKAAEAATEEPVGKTLRKMVENPVSRAMMNQGIKAMASMLYGDLVKEFALTDEEAEYFLNLKSAMFSRQQELGMKMMGAKDAAERQAITEEIKTLKDEHRDAVKTFLNHDEDFASYEAFEERLPERQQLDGLRSSMAGAEAPLRPEQEAELIEALYQARKEQSKATDRNDAEELEALANGQATERFEREWEENARRTADAVGGVLDEDQMKAFRTYQEQLKEMQLMGLKMAEKMFRPDDSAPDGP